MISIVMMLIKLWWFDCFRSFNSGGSYTNGLVQPIDIEEKINDLMENKEDGEEENKNDPCSTFALAKKYWLWWLEADIVTNLLIKNMTTLHMIWWSWLKQNIVGADDNTTAVKWLSEFLKITELKEQISAESGVGAN